MLHGSSGARLRTVGPTRSWIESLYGPEVSARFGDREISCSGTVIGSHEALLDYIDRLVGSVTHSNSFRWRAGQDTIRAFIMCCFTTVRCRCACRVANGRHVFTVGYVPDREMTVSKREHPGGGDRRKVSAGASVQLSFDSEVQVIADILAKPESSHS